MRTREIGYSILASANQDKIANPAINADKLPPPLQNKSSARYLRWIGIERARRGQLTVELQ
jgi:hypothetical protein